MNKVTKLISLLNGKTIKSASSEYRCDHADEVVIIFDPTKDTKKIMIPTDLAMEWVQAFEFGLINMEMNARFMRDIVKDHSTWAAYQHGFESHLYAIVKTWSQY